MPHSNPCRQAVHALDKVLLVPLALQLPELLLEGPALRVRDAVARLYQVPEREKPGVVPAPHLGGQDSL